MSPGQTGHHDITGQMGRVPGTDGTHTRGCPAKILYVLEEERRCNTRGGKASESLSEENCPLEALRGFFFSRNSHRKTSERSS